MVWLQVRVGCVLFLRLQGKGGRHKLTQPQSQKLYLLRLLETAAGNVTKIKFLLSDKLLRGRLDLFTVRNDRRLQTSPSTSSPRNSSFPTSETSSISGLRNFR
uniref:Uncharacterized protein n=1 Tax=Oncorhynchus mykiss TaxID=8022 RepID=A0A8K9WM36_ONCMY